MKVHVVVQDDDGNIFEGSVTLLLKGKLNTTKPKPSSSRSSTAEVKESTPMDFTSSARPFVKKHGAKQMSGPQKFVLLLAWMTKGELNKPVDIQELRVQWNKMTQLMGVKYNPAYSTRAKDNGWVDIEKTGKYILTKIWKKFLGGK